MAILDSFALGRKEVQQAAALSVVAAALLTLIKLITGIITNSIGIISEALHSGLDLLAAGITLLAVRRASRAPDIEHQYGHGKIENFAALAETFILWATSGWIIYEALRRIMFQEYAEATFWGIVVMVTSIVVDYERSQMLYKNARKHNSQALEADALHFRTDMLSSVVVLIGLSFVWAGVPIGDPFGAIGVSFVILFVSFNLAKRAYNALVDHAPEGVSEKISELCSQIPGVVECRRVRVRGSGPDLFVDVVVETDETVSLADAHVIADSIESSLSSFAPRVDVIVHIEPLKGDIQQYSGLDIVEQMQIIARRIPEIKNVHNIRVFEIAEKLDIAADLEMSSELTLEQAHSVSERYEDGLRSIVSKINTVTLHLESTLAKDESNDITSESSGIVKSIEEIVSEFSPPVGFRKSIIKREGSGVAVLLDCTIPGEITLTESHEIAEAMKKRIQENIQVVKTVYIHFEPS
ncbi:MAG: cation diffusion facilitator family transporter [Promethearchaeota archaeon]